MGEWLTRGTVWLALSLYVGAEVVKVVMRRDEPARVARWLNAAGCAVFFAHVACAFAFYHGWSHAAAYADTARQTKQFSGWHWGGGLYINYAFALAWLGEAIWSFANPDGYLKRPKWMTGTLRGFFLFMIFNGAVVFAQGTARWFGLLLCLILAICWWPRENSTHS